MLKTTALLALCLIITQTISAKAQYNEELIQDSVAQESVVSDSDEIDPFDPNIENVLQEFDGMYEEQTGEVPFLNSMLFGVGNGCYRQSCGVYARVSLAEQRMYLYVDGYLQNTFLVSSGAAGHGTPSFDKHPDGRIYNRYTSSKYPQGDYRGLGNMPYAVFISGGFAIHGTTEGNFRYLGRRASHGCIRLHPDNAYIFNRLVRQYGIANTWITVQ